MMCCLVRLGRRASAGTFAKDASRIRVHPISNCTGPAGRPPVSPRQVRAEEPQPVAVEDGVDVLGGVAAGGEEAVELLQLGDPIQAGGDLLGAEAAVEVAA